jgi:hypothetical protein
VRDCAVVTSDDARSYAREYRKTHQEKMIESARAWRRARKDYVDSLKTKCVKCGEGFPGVHEFHNVEPKKFGLSYATRVKDYSEICEEAKKTILLCANCHKKVHVGAITIDGSEPRVECSE